MNLSAVAARGRSRPPQSDAPPAPRLDGSLAVILRLDREIPDLVAHHRRLRAAVRPLARELRFLYLVEGGRGGQLEALERLAREEGDVALLRYPEAFGVATALAVAFREADCDYILTLTASPQVELEELPRLAAAIAGADLVVARRVTERPPRLGRAKKLEYLARLLLRSPFEDLRCEVRLLRRAVAEGLVLYGNQHRFLPLIAQMQGFTVVEVPLRGHIPGPPRRGPDLPLLLDLLTVFFLLRFVQKPFRFFGGIGLGVLAVGAFATGWLVFERLFLGVALADRPALVLSTLFVVLGIQILAVGLIGEIVAFAHARHLKDYKLERIVE